MKENISIEQIKKDLLSKKFLSFNKRRSIKSEDFRIVEVSCVETSMKWQYQGGGLETIILFKNSSASFITRKKLCCPKFKKKKELVAYLKGINKSHRFYAVFVANDNKPSVFYDAELCFVDSNHIHSTVDKVHLIDSNSKLIITNSLITDSLNRLPKTLSRVLKNKSKACQSYKVLPFICTSKKVVLGGDTPPDEIRCSFSNGFTTRTLYGYFVKENGEIVTDPRGLLYHCHLNELYYIVFESYTPTLVFSASDWEISKDLYSIPQYIKKQGSREEYLKALEPFVECNLIEELYGDEYMSVVNCCDYCYGIFDYSKTDGGFGFVNVNFDVVRILFNYPELLGMIMMIYSKIALDDNARNQLTKLREDKRKNGHNGAINSDLNKEIKSIFRNSRKIT